MAWILDDTRAARLTPAAVTGKPILAGGSLGREEATACGAVMYVMMEDSRDFGIQIKGHSFRVVIKGFV